MVDEIQSVGDGVPSDSVAQTDSPPQRRSGGPGAPPAPQQLPLRAGQLPLSQLIELYMAHYSGRDQSRIQRLSWWAEQLGSLPLDELSDDHVHSSLEQLAIRPSRFYLGRDADGTPMYKSKGRPLATATVNRYAAALGAVITWAIKRRIASKGYVHPCRTVERRAENNEKTRFLADDERNRLLAACRHSKWPMLYALVLMALTTGARRGELVGLRWQDIDLDRGLAYCGRTKNGDSKALPLVPAVVEALRSFQGSATALVFTASSNAKVPYSFQGRWRDAVREAKLRNFRFHDLRHSCASMLAQNGATLLEIADVLGHRQLQMTKRYSHLTVGHKAALVNRVLGKIE